MIELLSSTHTHKIENSKNSKANLVIHKAFQNPTLVEVTALGMPHVAVSCVSKFSFLWVFLFGILSWPNGTISIKISLKVQLS